MALAPSLDAVPDWVAAPVTVDAEAGRTAELEPVELEKGGLIEVVVKDAETGKPIERAQATALPRTANFRFQCLTDKTGSGIIRALPGGYQLSVTRPGFQRRKEGEVFVSLEEGKTERVSLSMTPSPAIRGIVFDAQGKPVSGAEVCSLPSGGRIYQTDAEGRFAVLLEGWSVSSVSGIVARLPQRDLAAIASVNDPKTPIEVRLLPGCAVVGRVAADNGRPLAGAMVSVSARLEGNENAALSQNAITDAEGRYETKAMPQASKYDVQVNAPGFGVRAASIAAGGTKKERYEVEPIVLMPADQLIAGVVADCGDIPVSGAIVSVSGEGQPSIPPVISGEGGKFVIRGLCKGQVRLSVMSKDGDDHGDTEVAAGTRDLRIVMTHFTAVPSAFVHASLTGLTLPDLGAFGVNLAPEQAKNKALLVCFCDVGQRTSRHFVSGLAAKADALAKQGVVVVAVQADSENEEAMKAFIAKNNLAIPTGTIKTDAEKTQSSWGVQALPWLILTDREHTVRAEGFGLDELDAKLGAMQ